MKVMPVALFFKVMGCRTNGLFVKGVVFFTFGGNYGTPKVKLTVYCLWSMFGALLKKIRSPSGSVQDSERLATCVIVFLLLPLSFSNMVEMYQYVLVCSVLP